MTGLDPSAGAVLSLLPKGSFCCLVLMREIPSGSRQVPEQCRQVVSSPSVSPGHCASQVPPGDPPPSLFLTQQEEAGSGVPSRVPLDGYDTRPPGPRRSWELIGRGGDLC